MFLMLRIRCICGCAYHVSNDISTDTVICPNCGATTSDSDQIIKMLATANSIEVDELFPQYEIISRTEADAL